MKKIKKEAIAHYERMIAWVKTTGKPRQRANMYAMYNAIAEYCYGAHCSYCKVYGRDCRRCPLYAPETTVPTDLSTYCCNGLWVKMVSARTWKSWLKCAEQVLDYIKTNG